VLEEGREEGENSGGDSAEEQWVWGLVSRTWNGLVLAGLHE
jgi:hypothetical protein